MYSISFTLDGCCDHRAIHADEELYRHAVESLSQADALLFGQMTYEMIEDTLERVDWNAGLLRGDLGNSGKGLLVGGVKLPLALAELGLIDE